MSNWIWLPATVYPEAQNTRFDALSEVGDNTYVVAEFLKSYSFEKKIARVSLIYSADTAIQLFCNEKIIANGPAALGGDFLGNGKAREWYYADKTDFFVEGNELKFFARVKMGPTRIYEYSKGHGGFMLEATVIFEDGTAENISTDSSWMVRKNDAYVNYFIYNGRNMPGDYCNADVIPDIWCAELSPIPVRDEKEIAVGRVILMPGETLTREFELDKIYAGFAHIKSMTDGSVSVSLQLRENGGERDYHEQNAFLVGNDEYRSFSLESSGHITAIIKNESDLAATVDIGFITTWYPIDTDAETVTSDDELNEILAVCKHTLKYCRQTHHLDSPRHCEPLACTGDYYIESLMTVFSFGDMRLAEFDVERTAELLRHNDGRMFHTTYSLIWVRMLYDVYMFGGKLELLKKCRDALDLLLSRFATYVGENGLVEVPPDYMFVDWIYIDGLSMHHPPKALGQSVLNMFYYMALDYGERIYRELGDNDAVIKCGENKKALQKAINTLLFDAERGIYFEGLNTPIPEELVNHWQSQNVEKRYYLKHSNIMAAYTSVCDEKTAVLLLEKIMNDEIEGEVQPYFMHYLLEAIYSHGLREKYTLKVIDRWRSAVERCNKGLVEGFVEPEPGYSFDHSHAWGGTPLYSLPKALLGLTVVEPGCKRIRLDPSLLGLDFAKVEMPTEYGSLVCEMERCKEIRISAPTGVDAELIR